jgi:hypothetical protein
MSEPGPSNQAPKKPHWTAVSVVLFVIGLLILVPSGLCTTIFGVGALVDADSEFLYMAVVIGGIPSLIGAALVIAGLKARHRD